MANINMTKYRKILKNINNQKKNNIKNQAESFLNKPKNIVKNHSNQKNEIK